MSPEPTRVNRQLAAELARLRSLSGLSMRDLGEQAGGIAHARVQRIERAVAIPSIKQVRGWLTATAADEPTAERVLSLAEAVHLQTTPWAAMLDATPGRHLQAIAAGREEAATTVCAYTQHLLPGLLQTSTYARTLMLRLGLGQDVEAALAARMRRQELLHQAGREFRFVLTHRALNWSPAPEPTTDHDAQVDRLIELDRLPNVSVRVLDDTAAPLGGWSSFTLYDGQVDDDPLVSIELEHRPLQVTDPADVAVYRQRFAELDAAAHPVQKQH